MKIFEKKQLRLREDNTSNDVPVINIPTNGNASDAINSANNNILLKNMKNRGGTNFNVQFTNTASTKPQTATTYSANRDEVERNITNGNSTVTPYNNISDSKIFKKKTIQEKRLKKLREQSVPFSKKELHKILFDK